MHSVLCTKRIIPRQNPTLFGGFGPHEKSNELKTGSKDLSTITGQLGKTLMLQRNLSQEKRRHTSGRTRDGCEGETHASQHQWRGALKRQSSVWEHEPKEVANLGQLMSSDKCVPPDNEIISGCRFTSDSWTDEAM